MNYYLDTEFREGFHKPFLGRNRHFIDLISIGIVAENGCKFYAISKDFDLEAAWNKYDITPATPTEPKEKVYWLRENVLKPIYHELLEKEVSLIVEAGRIKAEYDTPYKPEFCFKTLKELIKRHGKSNKQIATDIMLFIWQDTWSEWVGPSDEFFERGKRYGWNTDTPIRFYGYYSSYDWTLFCSLFGRMLDLPNGFPKHCIDLKQMLDEKAQTFKREDFFTAFDFENKGLPELTQDEKTKHLKMNVSYPSQENEHNALADARWNKQLHEFISKL